MADLDADDLQRQEVYYGYEVEISRLAHQKKELTLSIFKHKKEVQRLERSILDIDEAISNKQKEFQEFKKVSGLS